MEEILNPNLNSYFKGSLQIHQNVLDFMLIIPFSYPKKNSIINIIEWRKKKEDDKKAAISDIPCKFQTQFDSKVIPERILLI